MNLDLHLSRSSGLSQKGIPQRTSFMAWVGAALHAARRRRSTELAIRLVDAEEGRALNRQYRKRDYATNVLSFPAELPTGMALPLIGDLVVCVPVVIREADEQGKALRDHFSHMTVHGTLHLLGFDHERESDAAEMETLECKVLASLGVANPYQTG